MPNNSNFTILTADRLIDSTGSAPFDDGAILLQGDSIVAVGRAADVRAPDGAAVHTKHYSGCTIMPGMVDCHTHHNGFGDGRLGDDLALLPDEILTVQSARNARASLYSGVTTIRENGPKNLTQGPRSSHLQRRPLRHRRR
ncbi:MAG: amidohydrolase family protein, partial [Chloroflexi bacterium]|nr:amidohydrolase family protein [Chloroflexota bacterium]